MIHCSINDCTTRAFTLVVGCPWWWFRDFLRNAEFWSTTWNSAKFRGIVTVKFSGIQYIFAQECTLWSFLVPPRAKKTKLVVKIYSLNNRSQGCSQIFMRKRSKRSLHCNSNSVYIFLFWEQPGLSPNFHIQVSLRDLYIPRISLHISSSRTGRPIHSQTHECRNWN